MWPPMADKKFKVYKRFAFWPVKSDSGRRIWLRSYYCIDVFADPHYSMPIRSLTWDRILTQNEFLLEKIKGNY